MMRNATVSIFGENGCSRSSSLNLQVASSTRNYVSREAAGLVVSSSASLAAETQSPSKVRMPSHLRYFIAGNAWTMTGK
jgi:hypothetical protein